MENQKPKDMDHEQGLMSTEQVEDPWADDAPWAKEMRPAVRKIMSAAMAAVMELDHEPKQHVLRAMAKVCADMVYEAYGLQELGPDGTIDIDTLIAEVPTRAWEKHNLAREIVRNGNTINWDAHTGDFGVGCMCLLKLMSVIDEGHPDLCQCGSYFNQHIIRRATGREVTGEAASTLVRGDKRTCHFVAYLQD